MLAAPAPGALGGRAVGLTVLAATHRLDRIDSWCDGVLRLDVGRLVEDTASRAAAPDASQPAEAAR
jgi:ABC-type uncharacterized transport system ATPase subunit